MASSSVIVFVVLPFISLPLKQQIFRELVVYLRKNVFKERLLDVYLFVVVLQDLKKSGPNGARNVPERILSLVLVKRLDGFHASKISISGHVFFQMLRVPAKRVSAKHVVDNQHAACAILFCWLAFLLRIKNCGQYSLILEIDVLALHG